MVDPKSLPSWEVRLPSPTAKIQMPLISLQVNSLREVTGNNYSKAE